MLFHMSNHTYQKLKNSLILHFNKKVDFSGGPSMDLWWTFDVPDFKIQNSLSWISLFVHKVDNILRQKELS